MTYRFALTFAATLTACALAARAEVKLNALFADHAVLQRDRALPVWGIASPGEKVRVELAGKSAEATADADGRWRAELPALPAGGPFTLVVSGTNRIERTDVYVGEVWLASGQSNMEFTVSKKAKSFAGTLNEDAEIAAADYPLIRMFTVPLKTAAAPVADVQADWQVCSPETVGAFSAAGYFFARDLQASLKVPVGIVNASYGASNAQTWIRRDALAAEPTLAPLLNKYDEAKAKYGDAPATQRAYDESLARWDQVAAQAKADGKPMPRKPGPARDPSKDQHSPTTCWNAMIAPIEPYAVRGAIWYQGESNGIDNELYRALMTTLITDWRARRPNASAEAFPFLQVQLAAYKSAATQPTDNSQIANVREAQRLTMSLPNVATVTAVDIGDAKNIHPKNKQEVGRRLALAARATVYGEPIEWSGPIVEAAKLDGDAIRVNLTHAKGLSVKPGEATTPQSFAVRSGDAWRFADAAIDGETIVVKLNPGERPTELRYAWADNPANANVVNGDALPMLPFRVELAR